MNTDFLEKVVSNIFTNLLDKEPNVTTAKVQAIAETSVHYAFILRDTYEVVVSQKVVQAFEEKEKKLRSKVEEFAALNEKYNKKEKLQPECSVVEKLVLAPETEMVDNVVEVDTVKESEKMEDVKETVFEPFEDEVESLDETTVYVDSEDVVDVFEEPKTKRTSKPVDVKISPDAPVVKKRGRPKGFSPKKKP